MSHLLTKSQTNYSSAQLLLVKSWYCASVHCSYYSCVQMMKHYLFHFGTTDATIDAEIKRHNSTSNRHIGTHEIIINMVFSHINAIKGYREARKFKHDIIALKALRVDSDYKNQEIKLDDCTGALYLSESVNKFIGNLL